MVVPTNMGCQYSTPRRQRGQKTNLPGGRRTIINDTEGIEVYTMDMYDQKTIANLKKEIRDDLEVFLLDNMLLSVMFFENYDMEMARAKNTVSRREQEMSMKLMADHNKQCIMPDTAVELVNQRVRYRWRHGPKAGLEESLISQRMFVVYDTIEIRKESEETDHYSDIDKPNYRAYVQKSTHPGYMKLRHPQFRPVSETKSHSSMSGSIYTNGRDDLYGSNFDINQPSTSRSISPSMSDEYEYAGVNNLKTLRRLGPSRLSNNSSIIPHKCLKPIKEKNLYYTDQTEELYILHHYYDSTEFMKHFTKQIFPGELCGSLGFQDDEVLNATYNARAIYCDTEENEGLLRFEVIPAIVNPWPGLNIWASRPRPIVHDILKSIKYQWPTMHMTTEMMILPAVVMPRGCLQKQGQNPDYNFEWEICYPKAEKYMHTRMSHAQMKCYLFMAILHKTFIEPATSEKGLLLEHLRNLIYWECENNFRDWPENRLGEKMIRLLRNINQSMGKRELKDYFIDNKNIFESIPSSYLTQAHEVLHNVCERPVAHFIHALRNLSYSKKRFYPMFDFDELYRILTTKESMNLINPTLYSTSVTDGIDAARLRTLPQEQQWVYRKLEYTRRQRQQMEQEQENLTHEPRESVEKINLKWRVKDNIDAPKLVLLIKFFVEHFLKIAEKSLKYHGATSQALLYLKHSWYLTKVMEDVMSGEIYAQELQRKIDILEKECKEVLNEQDMSGPIRSSINHPIQVQVLKNKTVDLNKISEQFQLGFQKPKVSVQKPNPVHQPTQNGDVAKPKNWVEKNSSQPVLNGAVQNGAVQNGAVQNGSVQNGQASDSEVSDARPSKSRNWAEENILKRRSTKVRINSIVEHM